MIGRISAATMRGALVALLVTTPPLLLPAFAAHASEIVMLLAMLAGVLTFIEYNAHYPSFVEFRNAPPINRIRFVALFLMVFCLTVICKHDYEPTNLTALIARCAAWLGTLLDFPLSPVRLMTLMLPEGASADTIDAVRQSAGVAYVLGLGAVLTFGLVIRLSSWPTTTGAFNVWVNLPLFDPTSGGDVVYRLQRDARINIMLGFLLPFIIPAVAMVLPFTAAHVSTDTPQSLIWAISAWAFLPASLITRGMAMLRVADLIEEKRRRTYANAEAIHAV
ncbi:MAG: hypothetical protein AAGA05_02625 [Pseudomonadota bacterium]